MLGKCHRHLASVNWYSPVFRGSQGERLDAGKAPLGGWIFRCFVSKGRTNQPPRNHELPTSHSVKTKLEPLAKHLQLCLSSAFLQLDEIHAAVGVFSFDEASHQVLQGYNLERDTRSENVAKEPPVDSSKKHLKPP